MTTLEFQELLETAYSALDAGKVPQARELLAKARDLDATHRDTALLEIDVLDAEGCGEEAVVACEELHERYAEDLLVQYRLAALFLDIYGDVTEARPLLEEILKEIESGSKVNLAGAVDDNSQDQDSFHHDFLLTLSDCRIADFDPLGGLNAADAAMVLNDADPMSYMCLASAQFELGMLEEADESLAQALERDSGIADAIWLRGRILTLKGERNQAQLAFDKAVSIAPDRFSLPHRIADEKAFSMVVAKSIEEIPNPIGDYFKKMEIRVEAFPQPDQYAASNSQIPPSILAICGGAPPVAPKGAQLLSVWPAYMVLFQENLEIAAESEEEICDLIVNALLHETAHFWGLDEDQFIKNALE